jgi:hypothetical protein
MKNSFASLSFWLIVVFLVVLGFATMIINFSGWLGSKADKKSLKKQECIERTVNIKNEFTAKQIYKKCMNE